MLILAAMTLATAVTRLVPISSGPNGVVSQPEVRMLKSSWYGPGFYGKPMANGHSYNAEAMTVASPDLPFGTKLLLYNPNTGRQVVVTVTDRGPYVRGRSLDCSEGVARRLGFHRKGIQQLLTIRLNQILPKPLVHSSLQMAKSKVGGKTYARSSIPKFLVQRNETNRDMSRLPFYCTDYLPLQFRRATLVKQSKHII